MVVVGSLKDETAWNCFLGDRETYNRFAVFTASLSKYEVSPRQTDKVAHKASWICLTSKASAYRSLDTLWIEDATWGLQISMPQPCLAFSKHMQALRCLVSSLIYSHERRRYRWNVHMFMRFRSESSEGLAKGQAVPRFWNLHWRCCTICWNHIEAPRHDFHYCRTAKDCYLHEREAMADTHAHAQTHV